MDVTSLDEAIASLSEDVGREFSVRRLPLSRMLDVPRGYRAQVALLSDHIGQYGVIGIAFRPDGTLDSCSYNGVHPAGRTYAGVIPELATHPENRGLGLNVHACGDENPRYLRHDGNPVDFLGMPGHPLGFFQECVRILHNIWHHGSIGYESLADRAKYSAASDFRRTMPRVTRVE